MMFLRSLLLLLSISLVTSQTCPSIRQSFQTIPSTSTGAIKQMAIQGDSLYVQYADVFERRSLSNLSVISSFPSSILGPNPVKFVVDASHTIYSFNRTHFTRISQSGVRIDSNMVNAAMGNRDEIFVIDASISPSNIIHVLSNVGRNGVGSTLMTLPFNGAQNITERSNIYYSLINMYIDWNNTVYVQDGTPAQIQIVSYTPYPELEPSRYLAPVMYTTRSFAVDERSRTYLIDMNSPRITVYTESDNFINHILPPSGLIYPMQLLFTNDGRLLIADNATSTIHVVSNLECILYPARSSSSTGGVRPPSGSSSSSLPSIPFGQLLNVVSFNEDYWPTSIDIDENGILYATANLKRYVWRASLEGNGEILDTIYVVGNTSLSPAVWSAKLDRSGNWWILDYGLRSVLKWNLETSDVDQWGLFWWYYVSAVAVLPDASRFAIKAYTYGAVYQFDYEGTYLCSMNDVHSYWGGMVYDAEGNLWVADLTRLMKFSPDCELLRTIEGFDRFSEIGVDSHGMIYVAHRNSSKAITGSVLVIDPTSFTVVSEFGEFYSDSVTPTALTLDRNDDVFVSEGSSILKYANRYGTLPSPSASTTRPAASSASPTAPVASSTAPATSSTAANPSVTSSSAPINPPISSTAPVVPPVLSSTGLTAPVVLSSSSSGVSEQPGPGGANSAHSTSLQFFSTLSITLLAVILMF